MIIVSSVVGGAFLVFIAVVIIDAVMLYFVTYKKKQNINFAVSNEISKIHGMAELHLS